MASPTKAVKAKKLRSGDRSTVHGIEIRAGSTNVYADLGFTDADERFEKLKLALQINQIIEKKGWNQTVAAEKLGTKQPEMSKLKRNRLRNITYDRLMGWLVTLRYSVEIRVAKARNPHVEAAVTL